MVNPVADWTIHYAGGLTFSSEQGGPEESPGLGVLAVVIPDDTTGYRVMHGGGPHYGQGTYWWEKGQWFIGDVFGMTQYLAEPGWKIIRLGRTVTKDAWAQLWQRIEEAHGKKSSWWPREPRGPHGS